MNPACYRHSGDPAQPFRPTALVRALVVHDTDLRDAVLWCIDEGQKRARGDARCLWGEAAQAAAEEYDELTLHVLYVLCRDTWGKA